MSIISLLVHAFSFLDHIFWYLKLIDNDFCYASTYGNNFVGSILNEGGSFKNEKYGDLRKNSKSQISIAIHFLQPNMIFRLLIKLLGQILIKNMICLHW